MSDHFSSIDKQKIKEAEGAFLAFLNALGPDDVYKEIFLEVLFQELYGKTLHLSYWSESEGIQINSDDGGPNETNQNNNVKKPRSSKLPGTPNG